MLSRASLEVCTIQTVEHCAVFTSVQCIKQTVFKYYISPFFNN